MNPLTRLSKTPTTFCCGLRGTACSRRLARRRRRLWLLRLRGRSVLHRPSPPPVSHTRLSSAFDTSTKLTGQMLPLSPLPANTCSKHAAPPEKARGNILALYKAAISHSSGRGARPLLPVQLCQRRISLWNQPTKHSTVSTPHQRDDLQRSGLGFRIPAATHAHRKQQQWYRTTPPTQSRHASREGAALRRCTSASFAALSQQLSRTASPPANSACRLSTTSADERCVRHR